MGNTSKTGINLFQNQKDNQNENQKVVIIPYVEGSLKIQQNSVIEKFLRPNKNDQNKGNKAQQLKEEAENFENIQDEIEKIEKEFFQGEMSERIREDFETYSKENKMGKKKLLEYFGLLEMDNYKLGNHFFQCVKNTLSKTKTGPYLDYSKFLKTLSLLSGSNESGRLNFLYTMFDFNLNGTIEKEEMRNILHMFLEGLLSVNYENKQFDDLKNKIIESHERTIEIALDEITSDIYERYSIRGKSSVMTYDDWKKWLYEQEGFSEVLKFNPHEQFMEDND